MSHPADDCEDCGKYHMPWHMVEADIIRYNRHSPEAMVLYSEIVDLLEGRDINVIDIALNEVEWFRYEERSDARPVWADDIDATDEERAAARAVQEGAPL
ncbi:MAG: hypothetical protein ABIQ73_12285 [Acidimicrobiales bacterium]